MAETLYRRPLPKDLIPFSSATGRALFREALADGGLEGYFPLAEQFHTQTDPAFCGLGSLVVALNALGVDPGRLWKGPWRWYSEELLDCCLDLDEVRTRGLTIDEVASLAHCNGADAELYRAETIGHGPRSAPGAAGLRAAVQAAAGGDGSIVIASYERTGLGQTGTGHFSPLGGYHAGHDLALLLDVARFKYPPHWVPLERLYAAMQTIDPSTGRSRGWIVLRRHQGMAVVWTWQRPLGSLGGLFERIEAAVTSATQRADADPIAAFAAVVAASELTLAAPEADAPEHAAVTERLWQQLRATPAHAAMLAIAPAQADAATALLLVLGDRLAAHVAEPHRARLRTLGDITALPPELSLEISYVRSQLEALDALPGHGRGGRADSGNHGRDAVSASAAVPPSAM